VVQAQESQTIVKYRFVCFRRCLSSKGRVCPKPRCSLELLSDFISNLACRHTMAGGGLTEVSCLSCKLHESAVRQDMMVSGVTDEECRFSRSECWTSLMDF
jgi:hypothetical protein